MERDYNAAQAGKAAASERAIRDQNMQEWSNLDAQLDKAIAGGPKAERGQMEGLVGKALQLAGGDPSRLPPRWKQIYDQFVQADATNATARATGEGLQGDIGGLVNQYNELLGRYNTTQDEGEKARLESVLLPFKNAIDAAQSGQAQFGATPPAQPTMPSGMAGSPQMEKQRKDTIAFHEEKMRKLTGDEKKAHYEEMKRRDPWVFLPGGSAELAAFDQAVQAGDPVFEITMPSADYAKYEKFGKSVLHGEEYWGTREVDDPANAGQTIEKLVRQKGNPAVKHFTLGEYDQATAKGNVATGTEETTEFASKGNKRVRWMILHGTETPEDNPTFIGLNAAYETLRERIGQDAATKMSGKKAKKYADENAQKMFINMLAPYSQLKNIFVTEGPEWARKYSNEPVKKQTPGAPTPGAPAAPATQPTGAPSPAAEQPQPVSPPTSTNPAPNRAPSLPDFTKMTDDAFVKFSRANLDNVDPGVLEAEIQRRRANRGNK